MHEQIVTSFFTLHPPYLTGYAAIAPVVLLLIGLFWGLFANFLPGKDRGAALIGFISALFAAVASALILPGTMLFGGRFFYTLDARFAATAICVLAALWCLWTFGSGVGRTREAISLAMAASIGAILAVSAHDLIVLILVLELTAIPGYVLIGYRRYRIRGLEAALKYFLLSALSTLIMIYGMSFLVGLSAGTSFTALSNLPSTPLTFVAVGLVMLGLFAKLSVAPFHWWAPDACEGSEPWAIAFAAVVPKVAVTLVIIRLVFTLAASLTTPLLSLLIMVIAIVSLVVGAFAALTQRDIRRMMAYSGVVNGGYILIALSIVALGGPHAQTAFYAAIFYIVAYALATMGILLIAAHEGGRVSDLNGLSERSPFMAWSLVILALSMIGVPPLLGFFAKFNLFLVAVDAGQIEIVVLAVVVAVMSAFYYLRLIRAAFFGEKAVGEKARVGDELDADTGETRALPGALELSEKEKADCSEKSPYSVCGKLAIGVIVLAVIALGILYQPLMDLLTGAL
jgi:NADH-quinone oxidoreductase subunit N